MRLICKKKKRFCGYPTTNGLLLFYLVIHNSKNKINERVVMEKGLQRTFHIKKKIMPYSKMKKKILF